MTSINHIRRDILIRNFGTIVPNCDTEKDFQYAMSNMQLSLHDNIPCLIKVEGCEDFLYIGSVGVAYNQESLDRYGITYILNATYNMLFKYSDNPNYKYIRVPIRDSRSQSIVEHFEECFRFIEEARNSRSKVLVHCHQGKSRSTAIICAYLMMCHGMSFDDAFKAVKIARPIAKLNDGFSRQLREYEVALRNGTHDMVAAASAPTTNTPTYSNINAPIAVRASSIIPSSSPVAATATSSPMTVVMDKATDTAANGTSNGHSSNGMQC